MNEIENKKFETIYLLDENGKQIELIVEVPDDPEPQLIEYPSFEKGVLLIICLSFLLIIGLYIFAI